MPPLSVKQAAMLASAYELRPSYVEADALCVQWWTDSDARLMAYMEARHDWSAESDYAPFYVAALRQAQQASATAQSNNSASMTSR